MTGPDAVSGADAVTGPDAVTGSASGEGTPVSDRLILLPAVDVQGGQAVRLTRGEAGSETSYGDPAEAAAQWADDGAEWIHLVDLDAAFGRGDNREVIVRVIRSLPERVHIELSGGLRDDATLRAALDTGARRVNLGTAALEDPEWTARAIAEHGDRIAVGLDVRGTTLAARGWTRDGGNLWEVLARLDDAGCARYVVTDVTKDGTLRGPNLELLAEVLGGGSTSYLYRKLVMETGLAVNAGAWYMGSAIDETRFSVYAVPAEGVSLETLEEAVDKILRRAPAEALGAEAIERAKTRLVAETVYSSDSQSSLARIYGSALAIGETIEEVRRWPTDIEAVSQERLKAAAERWLTPSRSVTGYLTKAQDPDAPVAMAAE